MKSGSHRHVSLDCQTCNSENVVAVEYDEINYDPRDGHRQFGYTAEVAKRGCQCQDDDALEELAVEVCEE